jgi:nucleotide-binding universal stress UspA family protein
VDLAMFKNILVCIDGSASSHRALDLAGQLAHAGTASLTLMVVAPPVSSYVTLAGVSPGEMETELDAWAAGLLQKARALVPEGISVREIARDGEAGSEIVKELEDGSYDLVVLGSRGRGRAESTLLGSVGAFVHFHSKVPLLSVPDDGTASAIDN